MKNLSFPIVGTKVKGLDEEFNLSDPASRKLYFEAKLGDEIKLMKEFLKNQTFIAYMLGKKNSGKGTYSKIFMEIFGDASIVHLSIGDIVRSVNTELETKEGRKNVEEFLRKRYRGYISIEDGIEAILGRSQDRVSVPNEMMLALIEREIDKHQGKSMFIDGFPRTLDQISYSLFFRDLMGHRDDPDVFILIDIPISVIDQRIKSRVVCPICGAPRSTRLFVTPKIDYDAKTEKFTLLCDNPACNNARMVAKEGDDQGIGPIKARLESDEEILRKAFSLHGVPKVFLRNHIPSSEVEKYFDPYEITPEYVLSWNESSKKVEVGQKHWVVKDDEGVECVSLLPAPVVVSMIKQLVVALGLK